MNIIIRTDASISLGTGHVMRCLTLADELRQHDARVYFICRNGPGNLIGLIEKKGHKVHRLSADIDVNTDQKLTQNILRGLSVFPDWLIIDHYDVDISWESSLRNFTKKIMVIDDLASKEHDCDLLLNQNYGINENQYREFIPKHCVRLIGSQYALLPPQFSKIRDTLKEHDGKINRFLVFMGGADSTNETSKVLRAIQMLDRPDLAIDIVIGLQNPYRNEIEKLSSQIPSAACYFNTQNMAELMAEADISIGAGGTTTWERACLGLPSIVITVAENQKSINKELAKNGYIILSGWREDVTEINIFEDIAFLLRHCEIVRSTSLKSKILVDGNGIKRIINHIIDSQAPVSLKPATTEDCENVFKWRNHPEIRKLSFDRGPLLWDDHQKWFLKAIASSKTVLLIGEENNNPVGVLRYDLRDYNSFVSIYLKPGFTGKGIGTQMLTMGSDWIRKKHPDIKKITAEIIPQNVSSIKAFQKAGFKDDSLTFVLNLK